MQHGDYTRRLTDVPEGTRVRQEGPFGRFESIVSKQDRQAPLVLLGMGVGVAPLLSLAAAHHTTRKIHLLSAVRDPKDAYYRDVLRQYQAAAGDRMHVAGEGTAKALRQMGPFLTLLGRSFRFCPVN